MSLGVELNSHSQFAVALWSFKLDGYLFLHFIGIYMIQYLSAIQSLTMLSQANNLLWN